jgi:hypothetical protein
MACSIAILFILGSVPGWPSVMALTCVLGAAPNAFASPENNLLFVFNWACTSSPITASYFMEFSLFNKLHFLQISQTKCKDKIRPALNSAGLVFQI